MDTNQALKQTVTADTTEAYRAKTFGRKMRGASELTAEQCPNNSIRVKPFLKWAGGKRWLLPELQKYLPEDFGRYFEPFLDGGAVFFGLMPKRAVLSDLNPELIQLYRMMVRDDPDGLERLLQLHQANHSKDYYYKTRAEKPICPIEQAAWMLYLNSTCFNGLYRVNRRGEFNVPIGTKTRVIFEDESFKKLSNALSGTDLKSQDFEKTIQQASKGDFIYIDPSYTVAHNFNGFIKYNDNIFSWEDLIWPIGADVRHASASIGSTRKRLYDQRLKRLYIVVESPYSPGQSQHRQPLLRTWILRTWMMPEMTRRSSTRRAPSLCLGRQGSIITH